MIYYNIHNIVKVASNIEGYIPEYFKCAPLKNVDLEFREGDFEFNKKDYKKIDFKFYGGGGKAYFESIFYGKPIYRVLISDLNGQTKFYFTKSTRQIFGIFELTRMLLEIKLLQKGYTLIHGSGIAKDGHGYLLLGWPGVGKSSTIVNSKERGFEVLGDDVVILSNKGKIYCYPQSVGIFFNSKTFQSLDLSLLEKSELFLRYIGSKLPPFNRYISCKLFVDLSKIADIRPSVDLEKTYFLECGEGHKKLNKKIALTRVMSSTLQALFDSYLSNKMFYSYCYINVFDPGYIEKRLRGILEKTLKNYYIIRSKKKDFSNYFE